MKLLSLALTVTLWVSAQPAADRQKIEDLIAGYAKSISAADTTMAAQVWSQSPDVSFIHPLGHEHGFEQVKQNVYIRLMGGLFSERQLTVKDVKIQVYGDAAWAEFYWDFAAKLRADGSAANTHGRETQIYRKERGGWRLVHVHYSAMPATAAGGGF
jgi:ketosteroid isomerase-like protein